MGVKEENSRKELKGEKNVVKEKETGWACRSWSKRRDKRRIKDMKERRNRL